MKLRFGNKSPLRVIFFLYEKGRIENARKIFCRVWIRRSKVELSLNVTCATNEWDSEHQRCFPLTKQLQHINYKLSEVEERFEEIYNSYINQDIEPTPKKLKDAFRCKPDIEVVPKYSLLEFLDVYIEEIKLKPAEYGDQTISKYFTLKAHLSAFFATMNIKDLDLSVLSRRILDKFETYLLTTEHGTLGRAMNRNTCNGYMIRLRAVMNNALRKELIRKSPFFGFKIKQVKPQKTFLTIEEIRRIESHSLANNLALNKVRDIFLFCVYSGMRFSDAMSLKAKDVFPGEGGLFWISVNQIKTEINLMIPMLKPVELIFKKYEKQQKNTGYILPRLSNQKMNNHLKEMASLVGITKTITSHVARHTFATTIALENGLDIKTVSRWLGHANLKTTEVYAQVTKRHLSDTAASLNEKLHFEKKPKVVQELIDAARNFLN